MASKLKLVSVIIVTHKRLNLLKQTIASVQDQDYKQIEIIVVSDGEELETKEFVNESLCGRLQYAHVNHYGYPAPARNLGIQLAKGEYIAFCDDDDLWMPGKLTAQINAMELNNASFSFTGRFTIDENGLPLQTKKIKWIPKKVNAEKLLFSNFITYSSVVVNRNILGGKNLFSEEKRFRAFEDYHLWLRLLKTSKSVVLTQDFVGYRVHPSNISGKLAVGAIANIAVFKDVFEHVRFSLLNKTMAYALAYSKWLYYSVKKL